jgi:hypothetical protein
MKVHTRSLLLVLGGMALGALVYPVAQSATAFGDEEHNPRIHHAIHALHDAEDELTAASNDFHGHKQAAIDAVHHAIEQLEIIKDW